MGGAGGGSGGYRDYLAASGLVHPTQVAPRGETASWQGAFNNEFNRDWYAKQQGALFQAMLSANLATPPIPVLEAAQRRIGQPHPPSPGVPVTYTGTNGRSEMGPTSAPTPPPTSKPYINPYIILAQTMQKWGGLAPDAPVAPVSPTEAVTTWGGAKPTGTQTPYTPGTIEEQLRALFGGGQ